MTRPFFRALSILILFAVALALPTCVSAEQRDFVRYDAVKDEFHVLMILEDIRVKEPDDLGLLEGMYINRDHYIAPGVPGGVNIFPLFGMSFVRMSDAKFGAFNLFMPRPTNLDTGESKVPLNSIKIIPGTFFLQDKKLGYYQGYMIPGKTLDVVLEEAVKAFQAENMGTTLDTFQKEIERRAAGGKVFTWAELKATALKKISLTSPTPGGAAAATAPEDEITPEKVLELESVKNIHKALTDKSLRIARDKQKLTLALPLTAKDATETADLYKQSAARLDEVITAAKGKPEVAKELDQAKAIQTVGKLLLLAPGEKGLHATLDIVDFVTATALPPIRRADLNQAAEDPTAPKPEAPDVVKFIRDRKIPLDETLTADQILKDFNAGTLKAHPSEKPVTPGEGIASTQPK